MYIYIYIHDVILVPVIESGRAMIMDDIDIVVLLDTTWMISRSIYNQLVSLVDNQYPII
jgi:hypothetical protein